MKIPHQYQLFTAAESRELDRRTIEEFGIDGFTLMEIAGTRAADFILSKTDSSERGLICCGRGNNAGDALVVARILAEHQYQLDIYFPDGKVSLSRDCELNLQLLKKLDSDCVFYISDIDDKSKSYDFIVDGMLGTGLNSDVRSPYKNTIDHLNQIESVKFAMDIPTGLSADDGSVLGTALKVDFTLAFGSLKHGYFQGEAFEYCGELIFCELPFPSSLKQSKDFLLDDSWLSKIEHEIDTRSHKYDGGVVYIIAGSEGLTGAAVLASLSAWNTGVGAVILITPKGLLSSYDETLVHIIKKPVGAKDDIYFNASHVQEVDQIISEKDGCLLIGPGLGRKTETATFVQEVVNNFKGDVVIDADGLFAISQSDIQGLGKNRNMVLSPHPGELNLLYNGELSNRKDQSLELARLFSSTIVSKGLPTMIVSKNGETISTAYDTRVFSRAGFGDVLAGKIVGFLLQLKNPELSCAFALSDGYKKIQSMISEPEINPEPMDII